MIAVVTVIHLIACVFLILVVLLQTGKGAEMGAVFGGGGSSTIFGASGAGNFLTKLTTGTAIVFFLTSLTLAYHSLSKSQTTVFDRSMPAPPPLAVPGQPAPPPATDEAAKAQGQVIPAKPDEAPVPANQAPQTSSNEKTEGRAPAAP